MAFSPFTFRHLAFRAVLLLGLLMTGLVDEGASAGSASAADMQDLQAPPGLATLNAPAAIDLLIETDSESFSRVVYFPWDSIDLTMEAQLAVLEIASEVSTLENPSVSITARNGDQLLGFERVNAIARELETEGFSPARLFTWSEIDMLTPRQL